MTSAQKTQTNRQNAQASTGRNQRPEGRAQRRMLVVMAWQFRSGGITRSLPRSRRSRMPSPAPMQRRNTWNYPDQLPRHKWISSAFVKHDVICWSDRSAIRITFRPEISRRQSGISTALTSRWTTHCASRGNYGACWIGPRDRKNLLWFYLIMLASSPRSIGMSGGPFRGANSQSETLMRRFSINSSLRGARHDFRQTCGPMFGCI